MEISLSSLKASTSKFIARFHMLIFTVFILGGLIVCMLMINAIIVQSSSATDYVPASTNTSFDQQTIDRIKQLHKSSDPSPTPSTTTTGRVSPFVD